MAVPKDDSNARPSTASHAPQPSHGGPRTAGEITAAVDRIGAIARTGDHVDDVLTSVLQQLLSTFGCDRAWLLHPCDPEAESWHVPLECTVPQWPGASNAGRPVPMDDTTRDLFRNVLSRSEPLAQGRGNAAPLPPPAVNYSVRAQLVIAVRPRFGAPWLLGLHHCSTDHTFGADEAELLGSLSLNLGDALSVLLSLRSMRQQSAALLKANRRLHEEIAERRRAEEDLRENQKRLRSLLDNLPDGITVLTEGVFVYVNPRLLAMTGHVEEELLGTHALDYLVDADQQLVRARYDDLMLGQPSSPALYDFRTADGGVTPIEVFSSAITYDQRPSQLTVVRDMRQRLLMEDQIRQSQKMEVVGRLAGGVAHDFNNVMQAILGYLALVERQIPDEHPAAADVRAAKQAGAHATSLTRRLLVLGRKHVSEPRPLSIDLALAAVLPLLRPLLPEDVEIALSTTVGDAHVKFDPVHFEEVVFNLALNAREALSSGGHFTIDVGAVEPQRVAELDLKSGPWIQLQLVDDGCGMDEATRRRALEPFFTTKEAGSGLGLCTARDLVESHGGHLLLQSEVGRGTRISIYLPRVDSERVLQVASPPAISAAPSTRDEVVGRGERILLVEDEELLLELMQRVLEDAGYRVTAAAGVVAAREAFAQGTDIAMLLTDVIMPDGSGLDLAHELKAHSPNLPVLLLSGYSEQVLRERSNGDLVFDHLQKPTTPRALLARVRRHFDA